VTAAPLGLAQKVVALDVALSDVPHAVGGALALAYYAEPRGTIDIDMNVFVPTDRTTAVTIPLALLGVDITEEAVQQIARDGQTRVWWGQTPVDLFFSYDPFHDAARKGSQYVPFADTTIPVLGVEHLIVCKATFDRPKDWVDIQAILADGTAPDVAECLRWVGRIVGDDDPRYDRLAATLISRSP
jgi:hypothetical protein